MKKSNKAVWIGGLIGGVYSLIPFLAQILFKPYINQTLLIPFILSKWSMMLLILPIMGLAESGLSSITINILTVIVVLLNIFLWVVIGALIGIWIGSKINKGTKIRIKNKK